MAENKPIRPFSMEYAEAKRNISNAINEAIQLHGVPCYMLEDILLNNLHQVREGAKAERENALIKYNQQLKEAEKE